MIQLLPIEEQLAFLVRHKLHNICREHLSIDDKKYSRCRIKKVVFEFTDKNEPGELALSSNADNEYTGEWVKL